MNNKNKFNILQKFIMFLNEVSDEAAQIEEIVSQGDNTDSGVVSLKYYIDADKFIEVLADGTCQDAEGNVVADGEYKLQDNSILVVKEGKFVETKEAEVVVEKPEEVAEPQIEMNEEEKKEEETDLEEPEDKKIEEEVTPAFTLVDIEIEGETYQVPQEVFDYIKNLEKKGEESIKEIQELKKVTPSTAKIEASLSDNTKNDTNDKLANAIAMLNRKK